MGINTKQTGFTIIETMIVLGISSMLMVAVLVGSSVAVNQQRYRDSVMSLLSLVQGEYLAVTRVQNPDREAGHGYDCNTLAVVDNAPADGTPRGSSNCVIIGRVINVHGGTSIITEDVIGYYDEATLPDGDIAALQSPGLHLALFDARASTSEVAWSAAIVDKGTSDPSTLGILLLRSPTSGNVLTFINSSGEITSANVKSVVAAGNIKAQTLCVDSQGLFTGPRNAVVIQAGAATPNGVEQLEEGNGC